MYKKVKSLRRKFEIYIILYYALVLTGQGHGSPPLPTAEMLSSNHTVPTISHWLMCFLHTLSKYTIWIVSHAETDFSWALMQAALLAFNKEYMTTFVRVDWGSPCASSCWPKPTSPLYKTVCKHFRNQFVRWKVIPVRRFKAKSASSYYSNQNAKVICLVNIFSWKINNWLYKD